MLGEIKHPVTAGCSSLNLCANINGYSQQRHPGEIDPGTTLISFIQEEINIALVGVLIDTINDFGKQSQYKVVLLPP